MEESVYSASQSAPQEKIDMPQATEIFQREGNEGQAYATAWERHLPELLPQDLSHLSDLQRVNEFASDVFSNDPAFEGLRNCLGDAPGAREKVQLAVKTHNFPPEKDVTPEQYHLLLKASHVKEQLTRAYLSRAIENGATFGLLSWELDVLNTSCLVGGAYDAMCMKWRQDVQKNPANAKARELKMINPYAVIRGNDQDVYTQIPYAQVYWEMVSAVAFRWGELETRLDLYEEEDAKAMAAFLRTYVSALEEMDLGETEKKWREVDIAWMQVKGRVQPIPSREFDYYDPNRIRVFPDFRLAVVVDENLTPVMEVTRTAMLTHLEVRYGTTTIYPLTVEGVKKVQLFPDAYDAVLAGSLDFQPTGQSLPNDNSVRVIEGTKVFLNLTSARERWDISLRLAKHIFPNDYLQFEGVNIANDGLAIMMAGHEYGEPLLNDISVTKALGAETVSMLNEDAATGFISAIIPDRVRSGELQPEATIHHAVYLLGVYLRYVESARGSEHLRPYYEGMGLLGLRRMIDSGFIYQDEQASWRINVEALDEFYRLVQRDLDTQVEIAEYRYPEQAKRYLPPASELEAIPGIADLIARVKQSA